MATSNSKHFLFLYITVQTCLVSLAGTNPVTHPKAKVKPRAELSFLENRWDQSSKLVLARDQTSKLVP